MSVPIANLLDEAADWIEKNGWHQGGLMAGKHDPFSPIPEGVAVCAVGAIVAADQRHKTGYPRLTWRHEAARVLGKSIGTEDIGAWNDSVERTEQEVLDALRLAAKEQRR